MSLQAKEHTGGAGTGPLELFCSPLGIPHHTCLSLIPSLSLGAGRLARCVPEAVWLD